MKENDILSDYLQSLYGIEPLSVEEEHQLAILIQQGDEDALDKLVRHNLRFVVYVVRKLSSWQYGNIPVEDILAMGNEALFMAALEWKPINMASFATFAKPFINLGVKREINNTANMIRLPVNIMLDIKRLKFKSMELEQKLNRPPKKSEIAKVLKIPESRIDELYVHILREPTFINELKEDKYMEEKHDD